MIWICLVVDSVVGMVSCIILIVFRGSLCLLFGVPVGWWFVFGLFGWTVIGIVTMRWLRVSFCLVAVFWSVSMVVISIRLLIDVLSVCVLVCRFVFLISTRLICRRVLVGWLSIVCGVGCFCFSFVWSAWSVGIVCCRFVWWMVSSCWCYVFWIRMP